MSAHVAALLFAPIFSLFAAGCTADPPEPPPFRRGFGLGLYEESPYFNYGPTIDQAVALHANSIALFIVWMQETSHSTEVISVDGRTIPLTMLRRVVRYCHAQGLEVMLVPMVLIRDPTDEEWRGNMKPEPVEAWFASYGAKLGELADMAREENVGWLSIGSELASLEPREAEWRALLADIRGRYDGRLIYTANWDQLDILPIWNDLDGFGISGYYELADTFEPTAKELRDSWRAWKLYVEQERAKVGADDVPIFFTELGYPSLDGAAQFPWDYTADRAVDLREQQMCYEAFIDVWKDEPKLGGVYWYQIYGKGGPDDRDYTPLGKPAAETVAAWYDGLQERQASGEKTAEKREMEKK